MKTVNNKKTIGLIVTIVIVILAILIVINKKQKEGNLPIAKNYPITVSTMKPLLNNTVLTLPYLAQTENDKDVNLSSNITSRVNFILTSGNKVKKGTIIARLDNTVIQTNTKSLISQIKSTEIELKNLRGTHQRTKDLLAIQGASIEQFQTEESQMESLNAKLESLYQNKINSTNNATYATITSPVNGIISKTTVNVGDMCLVGHPVAVISATDGFYLLLRVPVDLTIYGVNFNNENFEAIKLNSTYNNLAEYKVYVNTKGFTTGDRIEVNVIVFKGNAIKLPFDAILNRDGKNFVFIKEGAKATPMFVTIMQTGEDGVVIANNELAGKEIVIAKQDILLKLLSGASIITKNSK